MSLANQAHDGSSAAPYLAIPVLEAIKRTGKAWEDLAPSCGVTNADPPWKTSLIAMCESLAANGIVPSLDRRMAEDELGETIYSGLPAPEHQLLSLAHLMMARELIDEAHLVEKVAAVRARLASGD